MTDKIRILTDNGKQVEASAPIIISASRSTDIPAFYAKWFFNRLAKGYCVWYNPFNQQPIYISFKNCRVIVFGQRILNLFYPIYISLMKWEYTIIFKSH